MSDYHEQTSVNVSLRRILKRLQASYTFPNLPSPAPGEVSTCRMGESCDGGMGGVGSESVEGTGDGVVAGPGTPEIGGLD